MNHTGGVSSLVAGGRCAISKYKEEYMMLRGDRHNGNNKVGNDCRGQSSEGAMYTAWENITLLEHWKIGMVWAMQRVKKRTSTRKKIETLRVLGVWGQPSDQCG